jgi:hypothetical protein
MLAGYFDPLNPAGAPTSPLDNEGWLYRTPEGLLTIGFRRASASLHPNMAGGDFIFLPTNRRQARSTQIAMRTDRTTLPAPLAVRVWSAFFRSAAAPLTDVYLRAVGDTTVAVLRDSIGMPQRAGGRDVVHLAVPPGAYDLALDTDSAGVLGRLRRDFVVPQLEDGGIAMSSLVLAPGAALLGRDAMLRLMPASLEYPAGRPLAAYVEIYGLATNPDGRSQYRVQYTFAPVRSSLEKVFGAGGRPVVFEFDRSAETGTATEQLVIEPDKLPAGRYRVAVAVTDLTRNVKSESVALDINIR